MAGLVPAIHAVRLNKQKDLSPSAVAIDKRRDDLLKYRRSSDVDGRDKPGHDAT
jgi:hypothetical protein